MSKISERLRKETGSKSPFSKAGMAWLKKEANRLKLLYIPKIKFRAILKKNGAQSFSLSHDGRSNKFCIVTRIGGLRGEIKLTRKEVETISIWIINRLMTEKQ